MRYLLIFFLSVNVWADADADAEADKILKEAENKISALKTKREAALTLAKKKHNFDKFPNDNFLKEAHTIWDEFSDAERNVISSLCKEAPGPCPNLADRNLKESSNRIAKGALQLQNEWSKNKKVPAQSFQAAKKALLESWSAKCEKASLGPKLDIIKLNALIAKEKKCQEELNSDLQSLCGKYPKNEKDCSQAAFQKLADESSARMCQIERIYRIDIGIVGGSEVKVFRDSLVGNNFDDWNKAQDPKCDTILKFDEEPVIVMDSHSVVTTPSTQTPVSNPPVARVPVTVVPQSQSPKTESTQVIISPETPEPQTAKPDPTQVIISPETPEPQTAKPETQKLVTDFGLDHISRYKTSECKWVDDLPKRVIQGPSCGKTPNRICTGYVICPSKDPMSSIPDFIRMAACRPEFCREGKARECVEDLRFFSLRPSMDDQEFMTPDLKEFLKGRGSQQ